MNVFFNSHVFVNVSFFISSLFPKPRTNTFPAFPFDYRLKYLKRLMYSRAHCIILVNGIVLFFILIKA